MSASIQLSHDFDFEKGHQFVNGIQTVLHCHHYLVLFTQLADDAERLNGPALMFEAAEETFYHALKRYFERTGITEIPDRTAISEQYFSAVGLGNIRLTAKPEGGTATMSASQIDQAWLKRWQQRGKPVNFFGQGFLAGALAAIFDKNPGAYAVAETASLVSGDPESKFEITLK